MGIKSLVLILASLGFAFNAVAQEEGGGLPFKISGDFAAAMSFYDSEDYNGGGLQNPRGNHDDFNVNLTEINIVREWSNSKAVMSIAYGSTTLLYNTPTVLSVNTLNLTNGYYELAADYGLNVRVGKFESEVGHETYNHRLNSNYTRSFGYLLAPYFNTGAMVSYGQDMWRAAFYVSNGAGMDTDANDKNKSMGLVLDFDPMENFHIDLNYATGTEGDNASPSTGTYAVNILDVSLAYMFNEMFDVALNYIDHGQKASAAGSKELKANSIAAYLNANLGKYFLGLRYEQVSFDYGIIPFNGFNSGSAIGAVNVANPDNSMTGITLTAKAEIDQRVQLVLEHRIDSSDDKIIGKKDDAAGTPTGDSFSTTTLGLMYHY